MNNIIFYVVYRIYKFKMLCRFEEKNEIFKSLNEYVKNYLIRDMNYIIMYLKLLKYLLKFKILINILWLLLYILDI